MRSLSLAVPLLVSLPLGAALADAPPYATDAEAWLAGLDRATWVGVGRLRAHPGEAAAPVALTYDVLTTLRGEPRAALVAFNGGDSPLVRSLRDGSTCLLFVTPPMQLGGCCVDVHVGTRPLAPAALPASIADVSSLVQAALDAPWLQGHLHPDVPGRQVLSLVREDPDLPAGAALTKHGLPVLVLDPAEARALRPVAPLVVTRLDVAGDLAELELDLPAEGVTGRFRLRRGPRGWAVTASQGVER